MSADDIAEFYVHQAIVKTKAKRAPAGQRYDAPVTVPCFAKIGNKLVRDSNGDQVVSTTQIVTYPDRFDLFPPGTQVSVLGRDALVIVASISTSGDLDLPDHCRVSLT